MKDEGRAYADKLSEAGVDAVHLEYEGMIHGFITMGGVVDAATEALETCGAALRRAFA